MSPEPAPRAAATPHGEIEARILAFLADELVGSEVEVDRDDDLLSGELLDSVQVLRLAGWVEEAFGVRMEPGDFVVENFRTVAVLAGYVARNLEPAG